MGAFPSATADARPNPLLFSLLPLPFTFSYAAATSVVTFLLRRHDVPVDRIAAIIAIATLPNVWGFALAPIVDLGLRRGSWVILGNLAFGVCAAASLLLIPLSLTAVTAVLFAGFAVNNLTSSALGALLSALPVSVHGRASGWFQAGNVGLGAVAGGSAIWLAARLSTTALAGGTLGLVALSVSVPLLVR
jgi:MFS transporter, PAT family, beta-lactamase induction signal transducer AmpG